MHNGRQSRSRRDRRTKWSGAIAAFITLCGLGGLIVAGGAAAGTTGGEATPTAAARPTAAPLFTQCPPAGLDTGCAILIVFNADGSTTVKTDPSQGPYDGSEDTLIGVQNNSTTTKASIDLTGTAAPFGFDGDGICAGLTPPTPVGCPFGPTGYEGPNTTFSNISADFNSGRVNFTGGLKAGASAYFSLEGVVTAGNIHPTGNPPNIFELDLKNCSTIHIGYNYFPVGTVIHWHVNQTGTGTLSSGSITTVAPTGKTMHFVDLTHSLTLKSGLHTHIYFNWAINGVTTRFVLTRGPSCA